MGELLHVTLPKKRNGIRIVTGADRSAKGGYQLVGDFVQNEIEAEAGTVLAQQDTDKTWRIAVVLPTGDLGWMPWESSVITVRKQAEEFLADPKVAYRKRLEFCAAKIREHEKDVETFSARRDKHQEHWDSFTSDEDRERNKYIKACICDEQRHVDRWQRELDLWKKRHDELKPFVVEDGLDRTALHAEREKLQARLEEIDALLGA